MAKDKTTKKKKKNHKTSQDMAIGVDCQRVVLCLSDDNFFIYKRI